MASVFISYSRQDVAFVKILTEALQAQKHDVWVDLQNIPPSAQWRQEIENAAASADTIIFVLSPDSVASQECAQELAFAQANKKRLISVVCRDVDPHQVPPMLAALNWIFFRRTDNFDEALRKLVFALNTDLDYWHLAGQLLNRARQWEAHQHNQSFALRGTELAAAERWLTDGANKQPTPTALHTEFITASRRSANARQARTIGALSTGLIVTLVLAVISSLLAANLHVVNGKLNQKNAALQTQLNIAHARTLAGEANNLLHNEQLDQALLVSVAADQVNSNADTLGALLNTTGYNPFLAGILDNGRNPTDPNALIRGYQIMYSADGKTLMISRNAEVDIYDIPTQALRTRITDATDSFSVIGIDAALSPDGKEVATKSGSGIYLWDAQTGKRLSTVASSWSDNNYIAQNIAFSPDGKLLATTALSQANFNNEEVDVWDTATLAHRVTLPITLPTSQVSIAFSPDSQRLATGVCQQNFSSNYKSALCDESQLIVWNVGTGAPLHTVSVNTTSDIHAIAFSPNGKYIAAGGGNPPCSGVTCSQGRILLYDAQSLQELPVAKVFVNGLHDVYGNVSTLAFSQDSQYLIANAGAEGIRIWSLATGYPIISHPLVNFAVSSDATNPIFYAIAVSPDGQHFATSDQEGKVLLWNLKPYSARSILPNALLDGTGYITPTPDGQSFVTGNAQGTVAYWNMTTGQQQSTFAVPGLSAITSVEYSPNGKIMAIGDANGKIALLDAASRHQIGVLLTTAQTNDIIPLVVRIEFSPDGKLLVCSTGSSRMELWDTTNQKMLHDFSTEVFSTNDANFETTPFGISFSPKGDLIAFGDNYSTITLWDVAANKVKTRIQTHQAAISALQFSPDGSELASMDYQGKMVLLDMAKLAPIYQTNLSAINSAHRIDTVSVITLGGFRFNPDQTLMVLRGNEIELFDLKTLQPRIAPIFEIDDLNNAIISPDGATLIEAVNNGPIIYRSLKASDLEQSACQIAERNLTQAEYHELIGDTPAAHAICPGLPVPPNN